MKVGQIGPIFIFPVKTVRFYWVESLVTSSILKMRKSHKKLAPVYAYPHAYTQIRDRGGWLGPPPTLNRVNRTVSSLRPKQRETGYPSSASHAFKELAKSLQQACWVDHKTSPSNKLRHSFSKLVQIVKKDSNIWTFPLLVKFLN